MNHSITRFVALLTVTMACAQEGDDPFGSSPPVVGGKADAISGVDVLIMPINNKSDSLNPSTWGQDENCFNDEARKLARWYRNHESTAKVLTVNTPEYAMQELEKLDRAGRRYDRVIFMGHGTPNGPLFCCGYSPQIGYDYPDKSPHHSATNLDYLQRFGQALNAVTKPTGWIYVGACNPGKESSFEGYTFLEVLSCVTGRHTLGTNTSTACWDVTRRITELEGPNRASTLGLVRNDVCELDYSGRMLTCEQPEASVNCSGHSVETEWGPCFTLDGDCMHMDDCPHDPTPDDCPGPTAIQCCTH